MRTLMIAISITLEAYEAVSATLPHGDVRGRLRLMSGAASGPDRLTALRGPGES
jgi:hypothetical protein